MIKIGGGWGESLQDALVVTDVDYRGDGEKWLQEYAEKIRKINEFEEYMFDEYSQKDEKGIERKYVVIYYFNPGSSVPDKVTYIDFTLLYERGYWD